MARDRSPRQCLGTVAVDRGSVRLDCGAASASIVKQRVVIPSRRGCVK